MALERNLSIRLSVEEADRVKRALEDLSGAARRMKSDIEGATQGGSGGNAIGGLTGQVQDLKGQLDGLVSGAAKIGGVVAGVGAAYSAFTRLKEAIASAGDEVRTTSAKVGLATEALTGGSQAFSEVARVAQSVGAPLEATAGLFARIGRSAADAGATSVAQVSKATETVMKLGVASGASTQEASAAALQLGQALASGRLQGDELRSILENMPALGKAVAKEFGVGVGQLRDMGAAGELVSDRVLKAILSAAEDADRQFAAMPKTVERASQEMSTAWTLTLGRLDEVFGVSKKIVAMYERLTGLAAQVSATLAPTNQQLLNQAQSRLMEMNLGGASPVDAGSGAIDQSGSLTAAQDRANVLREIEQLQAQIERESQAADREDTRRTEEQKRRLAEKIKSFEDGVAKQIAGAKAYYAFDEASVARKEAYDKAAADAYSKLVGVEEGERKRLADLAGQAAQYELAQKNAMSDRAKAAKDAEAERERQAKESQRAAEQEEEARKRGLETVGDQIDKLNEEAKALAISERARFIANETLKAEITLRKAGVAADKEMLDWELQRVSDAAGSNFDAKAALKDRERLAAEAQRTAERQAEEAERPFRNLFDNLQRGAAEMFDAWMAGTAKFGDTVVKVIRRAAAEFVSASVITPFFQDIATSFGIGGRKYDANAKGSSSLGGLGGIGDIGSVVPKDWLKVLSDPVMTAVDKIGVWTGLGGGSLVPAVATAGEVAASTAAASAGLAAETAISTTAATSGALTGAAGLSAAIPYVGGALAIGSLLMGGGLFGGKKSVGPGGGVGFGVDGSGKAKIGFAVGDNGYDAATANQAAADAVGAAAVDFFKKIGGTYKGTGVADRGAELGYDAGLKKYIGGDNTANGAGRFDTIEQAMAASLIAVVKNSIVDGVSKDIQDRIKAVSTAQDMEALLQYIAGLHQVYDGFVNWAPPMGQAETAMAQLTASFDQAKKAAESLSMSTDDVQKSYDKQKAYLIDQFNAPLQERYLRATGQNQAADLMAFDRAADETRKQAAALGNEAITQAEQTLQVERLAILLKGVEAQKSATQQSAQLSAQAQAQFFGSIINSLTVNLNAAIQAWQSLADSVKKFRDSLGLGALTPLSPEDQLALAQSQYSDLLSKAMGGDVTAGQGLTGAAQTLLEKGRSYYASTQGYVDLYGKVQSDLSGLIDYAGGGAIDALNAQYRNVISSFRGFASGGDTMTGEMVRVHPGELLYTGPRTRVFNADEAARMMRSSNDNLNGDANGIAGLKNAVERLIRVTAASGQMNAETQAQMAQAIDAVRRKAVLVAAA